MRGKGASLPLPLLPTSFLVVVLPPPAPSSSPFLLFLLSSSSFLKQGGINSLCSQGYLESDPPASTSPLLDYKHMLPPLAVVAISFPPLPPPLLLFLSLSLFSFHFLILIFETTLFPPGVDPPHAQTSEDRQVAGFVALEGGRPSWSSAGAPKHLPWVLSLPGTSA